MIRNSFKQHKRIIKAAAALIAALLAAALCCGCKAADAVYIEEAVPTADPLPAKQYPRLALMRHEEIVAGSIMLCPAVDDAEYGYISPLIYAKIRAKIKSFDNAVSTSFRIMCNGSGVLSMMISFYDMETEELLEKLPLTYDLALGREIQIQDIFEEGDSAWRSDLPEKIEALAAVYNMTIFSRILPIEDGRLFYLTGKSLVVVYRPYEITLGSDPWPEFELPLEAIAEFLKPAGAADRLFAAGNALNEVAGNEENYSEQSGDAAA